MFHKLTIKDIKRETSECVSLSLNVPDGLKDQFKFTQGQHLVFRAWHQGEEIRRSYSICSSPYDDELRVAVKKIEDGVFSSQVHRVTKIGDEVEVMFPQGSFYTELNLNHAKRYVMVAAGSGITPIISIIKSILHFEPASEIILLFGNRNKSTIIFKEEIEALKNRYLDRLSIYHILSREHADAEILSGRIDQQKINYFLNHIIPSDSVDEVFLCGPEEMIFTCRDAFQEAGVKPNNIHFELFYSAGVEAKKKERELHAALTPTGPISKVRVKLDAAALDFELAYDGDSILEAALKQGADLPYSCKGGVCATCKCKLESGEVTMDVNYSLEPDELARGFILACQSHPQSADVVVNFDIK